MTKNCTMRGWIFKITTIWWLQYVFKHDAENWCITKVIKYIISMYNYLSVWINDLVIVNKEKKGYL